MKNKIYTLLLFAFMGNIANAQYVSIPDVNFRNALKAKYPNCFNASDKMDTTCSAIVNEDSLDVSQRTIESLQGIKYFVNLKSLDCSPNIIVSLPTLPSFLTELNCDNNRMSLLPRLPSSLTKLSCYHNNLVNLPTLPSSLNSLNCSDNKLNNLPSLPSSLYYFNCSDNQLSSLPSLPSSLNSLHCIRNKLNNLPSLPSSLDRLNCSNNQLSSLLGLPSSLSYLNCSYNQLSSLPSLPSSLNYLHCIKNKLNNLPALPSTITDLSCSSNQLSSLPSLPSSLSYLHCSENKLNNLPSLPSSLDRLYCSNNQLTNLPTLPSSLIDLDCQDNQLTILPSLPSSLYYLNCSDNQLTNLLSLPSSLAIFSCSFNQLSSLPSFPSSLVQLWCENNPLTCLPILPKSLDYLYLKGTNLKCLPNLPVNLLEFDTILPICTNPSDICQVNAFAKGLVYNDANNNGIFDSITETIISNQIINVSPNEWKGISDINGTYLVKLDTAINNTWSCNTTYKYATITPNSYSATPDSLGLLPNNYNFGIHFTPNVKDLEATLAGTAVRPGFTTNIGVTANNIGTVNQSNITIKLKKPADYNVIATSIPPTSNLNDTLFWENVSIDFLQKQSFYVELQVPVSAVLGTEIVYEAWVNGIQGDTTPIDNYAKWTEIVRGSFDPNDKLVSKTTLPPAYDVEKDRLIYTIRFQNTGTDTAFYVRVKDEMPANLNLSTLRVINASHAYQLIVREKNIVEFTFPNINLPDKTTNEPKSHGFVQFSIQPKAGLPINTKIENNASIYFDYNAPIITNFATTEVKLTTGLASNKNLDFKLYPNPTNGTVRIELPYSGDGNWILSDISGRQLKAENIANNEKIMELNLNGLPSGTYFITIQLGGNVSTAKIIKM